MKTDKTTNTAPHITAIIRGVLLSVAITAVSFLVTAAVMTYGELSDKALNTIIYITSVVSVMLGALKTTRRLEKQGLLNGIAVGLVYVFIMLTIGFIITPDFALSTKTAITLAVAVAGGSLGGIIGINIK